MPDKTREMPQISSRLVQVSWGKFRNECAENRKEQALLAGRSGGHCIFRKAWTLPIFRGGKEGFCKKPLAQAGTNDPPTAVGEFEECLRALHKKWLSK